LAQAVFPESMVSAVPDGRADLLEQIFAGIDADLNLIRSMRQLKSFSATTLIADRPPVKFSIA
jgi:hypothetical protein